MGFGEKFTAAMCAFGVLMCFSCGYNFYNRRERVRDSTYDFDGTIDGERIIFRREKVTGRDNLQLTVQKSDGTLVDYVDNGNDFRLDRVSIGDKSYTRDAAGMPVLKKAEDQFQDYLAKILEYKREEGLNLVNRVQN